MKAHIKRYYQHINKSPNIKLIFPSLFLLLSFKPIEENKVPELPVIRKEFKFENVFRSIRIEGDVSVILTNSPAGTVVLEGKEKALNGIRPVVENNILIIDGNRNRFFSKLTIYLSVMELKAIQLNGDGNISSLDYIKPDQLHILLNGNIYVHVKTIGHLNLDTPEDVELEWMSPFPKEKNRSEILRQH